MSILRKMKEREQAALVGVIGPAKAAVHVLKDGGQISTARELESALFNYEAVKQEIENIVAKDPTSFLEALISMIDKSPDPPA